MQCTIWRFSATGPTGPWGSRRLRLPDLLDFRHSEGGKIVTLTHRPSLPPGVFLVHIFRGWVDPRAHGSVGSLGKIPSDTTGDRSRDPPTSSVVPGPTVWMRCRRIHATIFNVDMLYILSTQCVCFVSILSLHKHRLFFYNPTVWSHRVLCDVGREFLYNSDMSCTLQGSRVKWLISLVGRY
jgi:hypothetical protein